MTRWDRERFWPEHVVAPFRAALYAARRRPDDANRILDEELPNLKRRDIAWVRLMLTGGMPLINALRLKARMLRDQGHLEAATSVLEQDQGAASTCTSRGSDGFAWLTLRAELAALYRQLGRVDRASAIESDLRERLALADRDHAVLGAAAAAGMR
jgi:hypothetical protein